MTPVCPGCHRSLEGDGLRLSQSGQRLILHVDVNASDPMIVLQAVCTWNLVSVQPQRHCCLIPWLSCKELVLGALVYSSFNVKLPLSRKWDMHCFACCPGPPPCPPIKQNELKATYLQWIQDVLEAQPPYKLNLEVHHPAAQPTSAKHHMV